MPESLLTPSQYHDFSELITARLGIRMPESKQVMLQSRIQRRARQLGLAGPSEYHRRFFSDAVFQENEMESLLNLATTNKTEFLREADHFRFLSEQILPPILAARRSVRLWCAGCSTGEEAYTLAMVTAEVTKAIGGDFSIVATDVSTEVLQRALAGIYTHAQLAALPPHWRTDYFTLVPGEAGRTFSVHQKIRDRIVFGHLNLLAARYGVKGPMDVIFFRNVMIYFDRPTQREVVGRMLPFMRPDGYLFTAHAETLHGLGLGVRQVSPAVYQRRLVADAPDAEPAAAAQTC